MTNTIRFHSIRYNDAQGQKWTRLARPGMLDETLAQLRKEQPRAQLVCIDTTYRS